jgi:hypothetical protein
MTDAGPIASTSEMPPAALPLSKNQQKKLVKRAAMESKKLERRARERESRKRKRAELAEAIANGEQVELPPKKRRVKAWEQRPFDATFLIELAWDHLMTERVRGRDACLSAVSDGLGRNPCRWASNSIKRTGCSDRLCEDPTLSSLPLAPA